MILPKKGEEVPCEKIEEICKYYGLTDLWEKINNRVVAQLVTP